VLYYENNNRRLIMPEKNNTHLRHHTVAKCLDVLKDYLKTVKDVDAVKAEMAEKDKEALKKKEQSLNIKRDHAARCLTHLGKIRDRLVNIRSGFGETIACEKTRRREG
jgi:hypothetical protein